MRQQLSEKTHLATFCKRTWSYQQFNRFASSVLQWTYRCNSRHRNYIQSFCDHGKNTFRSLFSVANNARKKTIQQSRYFNLKCAFYPSYQLHVFIDKRPMLQWFTLFFVRKKSSCSFLIFHVKVALIKQLSIPEFDLQQVVLWAHSVKFVVGQHSGRRQPTLKTSKKFIFGVLELLYSAGLKLLRIEKLCSSTCAWKPNEFYSKKIEIK